MIINRLKNKLPQGFGEFKATNLNQYKIEIRSLPLVLKATYYYQERLYGKASELYAEALAIQPDNAYLNFKYGMTFYKRKKWSDAHGFIKKAVELNPHNSEWKKQLSTTSRFVKSPVKSKEIDLKKKVEEKPNDANYISDYAETLFNNKKYWMSKLQYQKLLQITPGSEVALFKVGLIAEKLSNYREALDYFMQVESINAQNMTYKYHIGLCHEMLGEFEDARIYYEVIEADAGRESATAKYGVGALHAANGHWRLALKNYKFFKDSIDTDATYADVLHYRIGVACEKLFQWDEAALAYERALELSDFRPAGWCYKCGEAYEKSGQISEAIEFYREAVSRTSDYKDYWWFRLGSAYEKNASYKEASEAFYESRRRKYLHAVSPKGLIQNKNQDYLSYYAEYYETLKVNENIVLVESFLASTISGNPYALLSHMLNSGYDFKYIVVVKPDTVVPDSLKGNKSVIFIMRGSDAYLRYLCTAKYLINNVSFPYYFTRKPEQVYLNTWHGTPMKTLGKDIKEPFQDHANVARNFLQATHIISPNRYTSEILLDRYDVKNLFSGKIAETGYPRVDLGYNLIADRIASIKDFMGLNFSKPVVLYAPTWRGTSDSKRFDVDKLKKDLIYLSDKKYQVVFKGHHFTEKLVEDIALANVSIAPKELDTNEILGVTDILITDYSSIIFDFLIFNRPVISYIYDYDDYESSRGLYTSREDMLGDVCSDIKLVKKSIIKNLNAKTTNVSQLHLDKYIPHDDGRATERVINFMLHGENSYTWEYEKKKQLLFFEGPFIPNGISRSFLNLMSSISKDDYDIALIINGSDIKKHSNRLDEFKRLPKEVTVISRIGSMPMSLEEISVRNSFESNYDLSSFDFERKLRKIYEREARRLLGDAKIHTAINFEGYALFWVALFSNLKADKKIIYQHNDKYQEWKTRFPYLQGVFNLYQDYDVIASVSQETMDNNKKNLIPIFNIPNEKFTYINNTLDVKSIVEGAHKDIQLEDCFSCFSGIRLINIGRMSHEKDQIKLIEAFKVVREKFEDIRLYILGDGDLRYDIEQKISDLGLESDVYLLGQVDNPFIYLKQSDAFVLSSNHEGQPMVLLESLTLGIPVIATDIVGNRSVLGDKYGSLVENSKEGLIDGMFSFLENGSSEIEFDFDSYQKEAIEKFYSIID
ncbi:CDP-glycerol glycerophosphotransferase family protein [Psychrobacter celer]|uniref:CDP-glycerol glycerophosphotransferase family protein n=1 Tax=Psychrobacter celer TaxID=306572 RepID=UPI003FD38AEA